MTPTPSNQTQFRSLTRIVNAKQLLHDPNAVVVSYSAAVGYQQVLRSVLQRYRTGVFADAIAVQALAEAAQPLKASWTTRGTSIQRESALEFNGTPILVLDGNAARAIEELTNSVANAVAEDTPEAYTEALENLYNATIHSVQGIDSAVEGRGVIPTADGQTLEEALEAVHDACRAALAESAIGTEVWSRLSDEDQASLAQAVEVDAFASSGDVAVYGPQAQTEATTRLASKPGPELV